MEKNELQLLSTSYAPIIKDLIEKMVNSSCSKKP